MLKAIGGLAFASRVVTAANSGPAAALTSDAPHSTPHEAFEFHNHGAIVGESMVGTLTVTGPDLGPGNRAAVALCRRDLTAVA